MGRLQEPFRSYVIAEGSFTTVSYILRVPKHGGHWIAVLPPTAGTDPTSAAILCDSMYAQPFELQAMELEELLMSCAFDAAGGLQQAFADFHAEWCCLLVGVPQ